MTVVDEWDSYERISDDPTDDRAGVGRQRDDTEAAVAARGGRVVQHHTENDTSAYKKKRVQLTDPLGNTYYGYRVIRPVWAEALRRLRSGEAKRLMVWDLDRLARDPRDLEDAIEVVEHYGAEIRSATASDIDLSTETGQMNARLLVLMAHKSSADTARRVKRQKQQRLAEGRPPGARYRTFGYARDWSVNEGEAQIVREVFERVAGGESVNSVTRDLVARDVQTVSGTPWRYQATARMLESRIYAGRLSYKGEDAGPSVVPALVSESLFDACRGRQRKPSWNARSGLLSGIASCSDCNVGMVKDGDTYRCPRIAGGCGRGIKTQWLDDAAEGVVWFLMMWRRSQGANRTSDMDAVTSTTLAMEVDALDRRIAEVQAAHTSGVLDLADAIPMLKGLRSERARVADAAEAVEAARHEETWKAWEDYLASDLSTKRTLIRRHVIAVPVARAYWGRTTYDPERFRVVTNYRGEDGNPLEFSGRGCGELRGARDLALEVSPDMFDRIEFAWGGDFVLAKGEGEGEGEGVTGSRGRARVVHHIEGGAISFDLSGT